MLKIPKPTTLVHSALTGGAASAMRGGRRNELSIPGPLVVVWSAKRGQVATRSAQIQVVS